MTKGYLVFTTHDGDELDATLVPVEDKDVFDKLKLVHGLRCFEEVGKIWIEYLNANPTRRQAFSAQAPGCYLWPFNDVEVLETYYLLIY